MQNLFWVTLRRLFYHDKKMLGMMDGRYRKTADAINYNDTINKPSINNVVLSGNKTTSDLFNFDTIPTKDSDNPITSGGVFDAIEEKIFLDWNQYIALTEEEQEDPDKMFFIKDKGEIWYKDEMYGTGDFSSLDNLPSINGTTLTGDKSTADLGLEQIQYTTVPLASATNLNKIIQYVGTTTNEYTNGYYYKCVVDDAPNSILGYKWIDIPVQEIGEVITSLSNLQDINISNVSNDQVLKYDATSNKWVNGEGGKTEIQEISKANFNALSAAEKNNGKAYFIPDINLTTNPNEGIPSGGTTGQVLKKKSGTNFDVEWANESEGGSDVTVTQVVSSGTKIAEIDVDGTITDLYAPNNAGGHTIEDNEGTTLTQRNTLQFAGDMSAEDDDEKTIVSPHRLTNSEFDDILSSPPGALNFSACFTPIGTIISVMGTHAPHNYLACDGSVVNISDYPELAGYFESQFGEVNHFGGDGTTTFAVPDLRGEFLRGSGTNSHENQGSGAGVGVHQDGTLIPNTWTDTANIFVAGENVGVSQELINTLNRDETINRDKGRYVNSTSFDVSDLRSMYYTSRPTNTSVLYCIATKNILINPQYNYSTEEQVVGTWIDGKPIYQKTMDVGAYTNNKKVLISDNIETFIMVNGIVTDGINGYCLPNTNAGDQTWITTSVNDGSITLRCVGNWSSYPHTYLTLQYTKTTD